jgi:hypothetical protein
MFEDFLLLVCTHLAMFWAGYKWGLHQAVMRIVRNFIDDPDHIRKTFSQLEAVRAGLAIEEDAAAESIDVRAEWIGDQVYIYREDTGEFLAQGVDVESAIKSIAPSDHDVAYNIPEAMAKKPPASQP